MQGHTSSAARLSRALPFTPLLLVLAIGQAWGASSEVTGAAGGAGASGGDAALSVPASNGDASNTAKATGGAGGTGAKGGNATASASVQLATGDGVATSTAIGGAGGGLNLDQPTAAGAGGTASGNSFAQSASGNAEAWVTATGGAGGSAQNLAHGGAGGQVALENTVSGSAGLRLVLAQTANGGAGGSSTKFSVGGGIGGDGGRGGDARSTLSFTDLVSPDISVLAGAYGGKGGAASLGAGGMGGDAFGNVALTGAGNTIGTNLYAVGGAGGDGGATGVGAKGGNAVAHGRVETTSATGRVGSNVEVTGGNGGGLSFNSPGAYSGDGGSATGSSTAIAVGGPAYAALTLKGGSGALQGTDGDGADSFASNAVLGQSTGLVSLSQRVQGGNGSRPRTLTGPGGGLGGKATSILKLSDTAASTFEAVVVAEGGGGRSGGTAWAEVELNGAHAVNATSNAYGGRVQNSDPASPGRGGDATASSRAITTSLTEAAFARASAGYGSSKGSGLVVTSRATSYAQGGSATTSEAYANQVTSAPETAIAQATAVGIRNGQAKATAMATGQTAQATALSTIVGAGANQAIAIAGGVAGTASATSLATEPDGGRGRGRVQTQAQGQVAGNKRAVRVETQAQLGAATTYAVPTQMPDGTQEPAAYSYANALPAVQPQLDWREGGSIVGEGLIGVLQSTDLLQDAVGSYSASAEFGFDFDEAHQLTLDLREFAAFNGGFQSLSFSALVNGVEVYARDFTDLAEARDFFTGHLLQLGQVSGETELELQFEATVGNRQGVAFSYLVGQDVTAVPEPQTWLMWLAGLGLLAGAARRRG